MARNSGNQDEDRLLFRSRLRRAKIAEREALPIAARLSAEQAIIGHLNILLAGQKPRTLAFCMPVRGEVDCRPLIHHLLDAGWSACHPVVLETGAPMSFRPWTPATIMARDRYGIPIPATGGHVHPEIALLPLVAFDAAGFRLGYGGGYFDRTLATLPALMAIGVGFELCHVDSTLPGHHDLPLDAIVTETGTRNITNRT